MEENKTQQWNRVMTRWSCYGDGTDWMLRKGYSKEGPMSWELNDEREMTLWKSRVKTTGKATASVKAQTGTISTILRTRETNLFLNQKLVLASFSNGKTYREKHAKNKNKNEPSWNCTQVAITAF